MASLNGILNFKLLLIFLICLFYSSPDALEVSTRSEIEHYVISKLNSNEFIPSSSKLGKVFQQGKPKINFTPKEATTMQTAKPGSTVSTLDQWKRNPSLPGPIKMSKTDSLERQRRTLGGDILKAISALSAKIDSLQASAKAIQVVFFLKSV